jgi:hypothetical protein
MFGNKPKAPSIAADFESYDVKRALTGARLFVVLARFESKLMITDESQDWHHAVATGVVDSGTASDFIVPVELTFENAPVHPGKGVGRASLTTQAASGLGQQIISLNIVIYDPDGSRARSLQAVFYTAAASNNRFVTVTFDRNDMNPDDHLPRLKETGYGGQHILSNMTIARDAILRAAPLWGWTWKREY